MNKTLTKPLKWHGGKDYLAPKIIALMPPRCKNPNAPAPGDAGWLHYVEPYFGGGSVLLANDPEGISEVANDTNEHLINFWRMLADVHAFGFFQRKLQAIPFSEPHYRHASAQLNDMSDDPALAAVEFFIRCRQSLAGRMDSFAPLTRNRTRRGMNEQASAWLNAVDGLPAVHERLRRVVILNDDALSVISQQDGPRTLFYLDPPYLHETRATTKEYGPHEMSADQHRELLNVLGRIEGRFLLSGYRSELYDEAAGLGDWTRHEIECPNNAAGGKSKRRMVECVWTNY